MKRLFSFSLLILSILFLSSFALLAQNSGGGQSVEGTSWAGTVSAPDSAGKLHENPYQFEFLPGNQLRWTRAGVVSTNGTWQQNGRAIRVELNNGYSIWLGTIEGDRMSGNSANKVGNKWSWVLNRKAQVEAATTKGTQTSDGWIKYSSTAGRFSIMMPGEPRVQEQPVDTAVGKLINHIFSVQKGTTVFAIGYADYPPNNSDPHAVLDKVRDGSITGIKGKLISGRNITHKNYPGREFQASVQGAIYSSKIFLVNNRLYQIVVVAPVSQSANTEVSKFLTSFDLKPGEQ